MKPIKALSNVYQTGTSWLSAKVVVGISGCLALTGFADGTSSSLPKKDPFSALGISFQGDKVNAANVVGTFAEQVLRWVAIIIMGLSVIYAIIVVINIMNMSKEDKEHHGTFTKWATVILAVVIASGLGAFVYTGLGGQAS